jgi:hypothetical protein
MMVDLDILIPQPRLAEAVAQPEAAGYRKAVQGSDVEGFHYAPLAKAGALAAVELHTHLGEQRHVLTPDDAFAQARNVLPGLAALSATHRIAHNVFHAAAQNRGHALGFMSLKDLCDFTVIARDRADDIEWNEVRRLFSGRPGLLAAYAGLAVRLLNWEAPTAIGRAHIGSARYWGCRCQLRWPVLRRAVEAWASVSYPIRRTRIEYLFGPTSGWASLALRCVQHVHNLLRRHGRGSFARIAVARDNFRDRPARW